MDTPKCPSPSPSLRNHMSLKAPRPEDVRLTKRLRDAAMACSNVDYRALLHDTANRVGCAILDFESDATASNLSNLNSVWAYGVRVLNNVPDEAPPAPLSGPSEPARLAA